MRKILVTIVSIIIGGLILYALLQIDFAAVADVLTKSRHDLWLVAFILTIVSLYTRAIRWHLLLDGKISIKRCFHIGNIAFMLNMLIPLRLGEIARMMLVTRGKDTVPAVYSLAGIVLERLIDLLILLAVLGLSLFFLPVQDYVSLMSFLIGIIAIGAVIVLILLANVPDKVFAILAWFEQKLPLIQILKLGEKFENFQKGLSVLRSWRHTTLILFWSFASWVLTFSVGYVLLIAFFGESSWEVVLFFNAFASVAVVTTNTLSYVPGAAGPYQASIVIALQLAGITEPAGAPLAFAIILHLVNFISAIVTGIIGMFSEELSFMKLFRLQHMLEDEPSNNR